MSQFSVQYLSRTADMLTTALAHFVWQGTVLSLMLFVVVKLAGVRSVQTRYLLSVITLAMMGLAPVITILWHRHSAVSTHFGELSNDSTIVLVHSFAVATGKSEEMKHVSDILHRPDVQLAVLISWLAGVLIFSTRLLVGFGITLWIRANVKPVSQQIEELSRRLGERMRVTIGKRVFASLRIGQAVAVGFFRPVVLIPAAWLTQLTPEMLEAVIAHELAHIRRWDLWVNLVQRLFETLLFYHPAVWWLSHRIRLEREMCCDETAADCLDRAVYVRSLESVARIARGDLLLATSIQGGTQMKLLTRIQHLVGAAPADAGGNWWAAGFVAMIFPLMAVVAFSLTAGPMPSTAIADDGKKDDTVITGGLRVHLEADNAYLKKGNAGVELTVRGAGRLAMAADGKKSDSETSEEAEGFHIIADHVTAELKTVGDIVGITMTGDLAKKYLGNLGVSVRDGGDSQVETTGYIEQILSDGRYRIEHSTRIARDKKSPKLLTVTAIVDAKKLQTRIVPKKTAILTSPNDTNPTFSKSDQKYRFVVLSDFKGIKIQTWELKDEVGE